MREIDLYEIKRELEGLKNGERGARVEKIAASYGMSKDKLYRLLREKFGRTKTVKRDSKITNQMVDLVAKLKVEGESMIIDARNGREISTEVCIQKLIDQGHIEFKDVSISQINLRLRSAGFRFRAPYVRVEAEYPDQQHQIDFTRSKYFQVKGFDSESGEYILKVSSRVLNYKQGDDKSQLRTWIVGVIDAYSRVAIAKAYVAAGESQDLGRQFMHDVYCRPEDDNPLRSLPETLKADNGAFMKDRTKRFLQDIEVHSESTTPYGHRGIQKIEAFWTDLWRSFELPLAMDLKPGAELTLADYNSYLAEYIMKKINENHPLRSGSRKHDYLAGLAKASRYYVRRFINEDLWDHFFSLFERLVPVHLIVSIRDSKRNIDVKLKAPAEFQGQKCEFYVNSQGEWFCRLKEKYSESYQAEVVSGSVPIGNFEHRHTQTYRERIETEVEQNKKGVSYFPAPKKEQKINSIKAKAAAAAKEFGSAAEAREYVIENLPTGVTYVDISANFEKIFELTLEKEKIQSAIDQLRIKVNFG